MGIKANAKMHSKEKKPNFTSGTQHLRDFQPFSPTHFGVTGARPHPTQGLIFVHYCTYVQGYTENCPFLWLLLWEQWAACLGHASPKEIEPTTLKPGLSNAFRTNFLYIMNTIHYTVQWINACPNFFSPSGFEPLSSTMPTVHELKTLINMAPPVRKCWNLV